MLPLSVFWSVQKLDDHGQLLSYESKLVQYPFCMHGVCGHSFHFLECKFCHHIKCLLHYKCHATTLTSDLLSIMPVTAVGESCGPTVGMGVHL